MNKETICKSYKKEVRKALKFSGKEKKRFLAALENDLADFLTDHPDASESDLREYFGEPKKYAEEFLAGVDKEKLEKMLSKSRRGWIIWILVAVILTLLVAATIVYLIIDNKNTKVVYYSEEITYDSVTE